MDPDEKVRENRLRRMAERQGYGLMKSRRRDPQAYDFGTYRLIDPFNNTVVLADSRGYGKDLDDIEAFLVGDTPLRDSKEGPG